MDNMKQIGAALDIIHDSERLILSLKVSINSSSSEKNLIENALIPYLEKKKRTLRLKMFFLSLRAGWLKATEDFRSAS